MRYKDQLQKAPMSTVGDSRIRRASYYVWFLGAEECRGLRGPEVVRPILQYLLQRERENEPEKVTLQVSVRGIKLLQQGVTSRAAAAGSTKHFIPSGALTHVQQEEAPDDDIVSAVLLIYNPLTRCPVHVHSYRCDSTETASLLKDHLMQLLQRPEQQTKLAALESRLASRGLLPSSSRASDGASSGSSVSSGAGSGSGKAASGEKMVTLYDSLAAELREKLGTSRNGPLLFPARDYDSRAGRRRIKKASESSNGHGRKAPEDDSARSSGIGSDDASSPTQERDYPAMEHPSSSDEEWTGHELAEIKGESSLLLVQPWPQNAAPRRTHPKDRSRKPSPPRPNLSPIKVTRRPSRRVNDSNISQVSPHDRFQDARDKFLSLERQRSAVDVSTVVHPDGINRSTSWDVGQRGQPLRNDGRKGGRKSKRDILGSREDLMWQKSEVIYATRDQLRHQIRDRDIEPWRRDVTRKPDFWEHRVVERSLSPHRGRARDQRMPRQRSPDRHEYQRAKSMHDLSQKKYVPEDDRKGSRDPRRHSLYDPPDEPGVLQETKRSVMSSYTHLNRPHSSCSSESSVNYNELPDNQRFPGLDRATARHQDALDLRASKKTFDYPVNGGHAPIHITRAHHDDYRRFRYDHGNGQPLRSPVVPTAHY